MSQALEIETKKLFTCPRCQKELEVNLDNFYYGKGVAFLFSCKTCYKLYRKELREKKKLTASSIPDLELEAKKLLSKVVDLAGDLNIGYDRDGKLDQILTRAKFEYLGEGIDRVTYLAPNNLVIKIDRNYSRNYGQSHQEIKNYKNIPKRAKHLFIPLLAWTDDSHFLIVPKALRDEDGIEGCRVASKLREEFERLKITVTDIHEGNVGLVDGKEVMIDYGFGISSSGKMIS